jgi:probable rRNA maturation factor
VKSAIPKISVRNLQRKVAVDVVELEDFATKALKLCLQLAGRNAELRGLPEIAVLIVSDSRIATLHQKFMGEAGPTDVITFQHGEIFVSVETARRQARQFENSLNRELKLYIVHGLLHLHGFEDRNARDAKRMGAVQSRILRRASL